MQNKVMRNSLILLLVGIVVVLSGCGKPKPAEQIIETNVQENAAATSTGSQVPDEKFELHGDYAIDLTDLGMALTFYLRIDEDSKFILSANRQFASDRGSGTIGELDGTYLMIYSDSTPEKSKTATFERIGHNLIFRTPLPYGSANISFEAVDSDNPEIIHHLMANKYVYEEYYDTYLGFSSEDGVDYEYVLNLGPGARYHYVSTHDSLGETVQYEERGTFRVTGQNFGLTPQGEMELWGAITDDGGLELSVKSSAISDREERLLRVATTAKHAGNWYAQQSIDNGEAQAALELDYFGGYTFTSIYNDVKHVEQGAFEATNGTMTFTPSGDQSTPIVGTKANYTLNATFDLSDTVKNVEWHFYDAAIQGEFSGGTMVNEAYLATLTMNADGSFELVIVDQENDNLELMRQNGTFNISAGPMAHMVTLTAPASVSAGEIWPTGLNLTFEIDGTNYSFMLTK